MNSQPIVGDWVVFNADGFGEFRYVAQRVTRVTAQKVMTREAAYGERHHSKEKVLFVGSEFACRGMAERLTSSVALMKDECRRSRKRHQKRAANILRGEA